MLTKYQTNHFHCETKPRVQQRKEISKISLSFCISSGRNVVISTSARSVMKNQLWII